MTANPIDQPWPGRSSSDGEDTGPRHIRQVLQEWSRWHEIVLAEDARSGPSPTRAEELAEAGLAVGV